MNRRSYSVYSTGDKEVYEHRVIAEGVLGRQLKLGEHVHHVDGDGHNNEHSNLVICPSKAYHALLHVRSSALNECGNANWLRCIRCKQWDDPKNNMYLYVPKDQTSPRAEHRGCRALYLSVKNRQQRKEGVT